MTNPATAVAILNWNGRHFLEKFLPDVVANSRDAAKVYVIDNASSDDSVDYIKQNFPEVPVIKLPENLGYTGGYNKGLAEIDARYFILLNSDVKVTPGWITPVISVMEQDPQIAACQPKILSYAEPGKFEYAGAAGGFIDRYGYPFCRGRIFNTIEEDTHQYDDPCDVMWASGACMFVRAEAFRSAGGFDERFFAHMEEIDLCWRFRRSGLRIRYCPKSVVYHLGGGTLQKSNPRKTYLNFRNNLLMLDKNLPDEERRFVMKRRKFLDAIAALSFLLRGSGGDYEAVRKAYKDFSEIKQNSIPGAYSQKAEYQPDNTIYPKSILREYYLCRRKKFSRLPWNTMNGPAVLL